MAGRKSDGQGRPLLIRDNRLAVKNFGMEGANFTSTPKSKYMFYVRFMRADGAGSSSIGGSGVQSTGALDWTNGVGFALKYIDRPKVTFEQQTLNQYNKKRIVQTKSEYEPLVMRFHDTIDNKVHNLFVEYYRYYYGDPQAVDTKNWQYDITSPTYMRDVPFGLLSNPNRSPNSNYFFDHIEVYQIYGRRRAYRFDLVQPKILSFDPDELDYANGSIGNEITMQVNFEGIIYFGDMGIDDDLLGQMTLDVGDFFESEEAELSPEAFLKSTQEYGVETGPSGIDGILRNTFTAAGNAAVTNLINGRGLDTGNIIQNGIYNGLFQSATNTGGPLSSITRNAQNTAQNFAKSRITDSVNSLKGKFF